MELKVAFLLHAYQPWWQFSHVLERIISECYFPDFSKLANDERYRMSLNINYSLIELFLRDGHHEMVSLVQRMIDTGRIELTATPAYHPFMPRIAEKQMAYQTDLQNEMMGKLFTGYNPKGFYPPEMAVSPEVLRFIASRGYAWTLTDDPPFVEHHKISPTYSHLAVSEGIPVFLRSKAWSYNKIADGHMPGKQVAWEMADCIKRWTNGKDAYLVLAMDFETFDHWEKGYWDRFFLQFLSAIERPIDGVNISLANLSELYGAYMGRRIETVIPRGSQSTSQEDYAAGNFYPLWEDTGYHKMTHDLLWKIYDLAEESIDGNPEAKLLLAKGTNSCSWWQPARKKPQFAQPGIDMMVRAAEISGNPEIGSIYRLRDDAYKMLDLRKAA